VVRLSENPELVRRLAMNTPQPMSIGEHVERILDLYQLAGGYGRRLP
jgi:hypothetical protein